MSFSAQQYSVLSENSNNDKLLKKLDVFKNDELTEYVIKIDSKDRNITTFPDPFSFRVRFNASDNDGATPVIFCRYQNIKYIKLIDAIIPRYNISQSFEGGDETFNKNCLLNSFSSIKTNSNLNIILKNGDFIKFGNDILKVIDFCKFPDYDYITVDKYPSDNESKIIEYYKIKFKGYTIFKEGKKFTNIINGLGTLFLNLNINYILIIKNKKYTIKEIVSDTKLIVHEQIYDLIDSIDMFLEGSSNIEGEFINKKNSLCILFKKNYDIELNTIEKDDIMFIHEKFYEVIEFNLNKALIKLKQDLHQPVLSHPSIPLKIKLFKYLPGNIYWNGNKLIGEGIDFYNYGIGSIIYLSDSSMNQPNGNYVYLKILSIISQTEMSVERIIGNKNEYITGSGLQTIYNFSYVNNVEDFNNTNYILMHIDEFKNDVCQGTNPKLSSAFGILYPKVESDYRVQLEGTSSRTFPMTNLQNLNKMTISFSNSSGEKIKLNNLNSNTDKSDIRNPLNPYNQVLLTFKIGVVNEKFN